MAHRYHDMAFTPTVKAVQEALGSRETLAERADRVDGVSNAELTASEAAFMSVRDSFYMATVSETGWPYMQHRGGPPGFVKILDQKTIGFADFAGNRQYVSVGNLMRNDRTSLFFMDYANRARLKVYGTVRLIDANSPQLMQQLIVSGYRARVERGFVIQIDAFDWNCSQHITPRFASQETDHEFMALRARVVELERALATATGQDGRNDHA